MTIVGIMLLVVVAVAGMYGDDVDDGGARMDRSRRRRLMANKRELNESLRDRRGARR